MVEKVVCCAACGSTSDPCCSDTKAVRYVCTHCGKAFWTEGAAAKCEHNTQSASTGRNGK